jgi:hypothetical protein
MIFVNCGLKKALLCTKMHEKVHFWCPEGVRKNKKMAWISQYFQNHDYLSVNCLIIIIAKKKILSRTSPLLFILLKMQKGVNWCYNKPAKRCKLLYK